MADFCTKCHQDHGFPGEPDINVEKIFSTLNEGFMVMAGTICEGCGMVAIAKQDDKCLVARESTAGSFVWDPYED